MRASLSSGWKSCPARFASPNKAGSCSGKPPPPSNRKLAQSGNVHFLPQGHGQRTQIYPIFQEWHATAVALFLTLQPLDIARQTRFLLVAPAASGRKSVHLASRLAGPGTPSRNRARALDRAGTANIRPLIFNYLQKKQRTPGNRVRCFALRPLLFRLADVLCQSRRTASLNRGLYLVKFAMPYAVCKIEHRTSGHPNHEPHFRHRGHT